MTAAPRIRTGRRRQATTTVLGVKLKQTGTGWETADGRWRIEYVEDTPPYWTVARADGSPIWKPESVGEVVTETARRTKTLAVRAILVADSLAAAA